MPDSVSPAEPVLFEQLTPHIALVTLNRPDKRNAVNPALAQALDAILLRIEDDPHIRVAILTSSDDRVFCAGADLAAVAAGQGRELDTPTGGFAGFVYAQRQTPWIAAVEGLAIGGGFEICLACDMIVASEQAKFALSETRHGMMAAAGGIHRIMSILPRNIGHELIATGDKLDAASAHHHGLVNRLAAPGEALTVARALAETISANAPLAVQYSLATARASLGQPDGAGRVAAAERMAALRKSHDFREGPRAFVEKRAPVWTGR